MGSNIIREVKIGAQLGRGHLNIVKPKELILTRWVGWETDKAASADGAGWLTAADGAGRLTAADVQGG